MANWNDKSADYEDYEDGLYDFGHGIPVEDRSTNLVNFNDEMFNPGRPTVWDRFTGNTSYDFLNRFTDEQLLSGSHDLGYLDKPIAGNTTVWSPSRGRGLEIISDNTEMDFLANALNTVANPLSGSVFNIDTARVRDPVTGEELNFESSSGYLGDSRIVSDAALTKEREIAERNRQQNADDNTNTRDNTGGLLAVNEQGDIPWYVLANAGLLAV